MTKNPTIKNRDRDKSSYEIIKNIIATIKKHEIFKVILFSIIYFF